MRNSLKTTWSFLEAVSAKAVTNRKGETYIFWVDVGAGVDDEAYKVDVATACRCVQCRVGLSAERGAQLTVSNLGQQFFDHLQDFIGKKVEQLFLQLFSIYLRS